MAKQQFDDSGDEGGWTTIDPSKVSKSLNNVEKVDYAIEGEDDNDADTNIKVEAKDDDFDENYVIEDEEDEVEEVQEQPDEAEDTGKDIAELEGINTKGAEKRIRQLVQQRKEREARIEEMDDELNRLRSELIKTQQNTKTYELSSLSSKENELEARIKAAENNYLRAYDEGEKEQLLEAQSMLNDAKTDLKIIQARKAQLQAAKEREDYLRTNEYNEDQEYREEPRRQPVRQYQQAQADPLAEEWLSNNSWFGKDEVATVVALAVDQKLKNEGYDPQSKEFYNEIDRLVREELPHKFNRGTGNTRKPSQVVAGSSRKSSPNKKSSKVKLTQQDVALAKKWGIPLDRYAAEKKKVDSYEGTYTAINTKRV